ncbi:efflux RND transporter periplasmic adaptor subunit [Magnetococcales bacterium HHB-1]
MTRQKKSLKRWLFWIPLLCGILVMAMIVRNKKSPEIIEPPPVTYKVRVFPVKEQSFTPKSTGYGLVEPAQIWNAVAQVSGHIIWRHARLRNGSMIPKGEILLKIDPTRYQLLQAQLEAELQELTLQQKNANALLTIEKRKQGFSAKKLQRQRRLIKTKVTSQSKLDQTALDHANIEKSVQDLKNTLRLIPAKKAILLAKIAQAKLDLDHTIIRAPFNLRIAKLNIEQAQFIPSGQMLFEGYSIDKAEISGQFSLSAISALISQRTRSSQQSTVQMDGTLPQRLNFSAQVILNMENRAITWDAQVVRFRELISPDTRTLGVVVAVSEPYKKAKIGLRPPLIQGMHVQIDLYGQQQKNQHLIPREAVHDNQVYIADNKNQLQVRPVRIRYVQQGVSVIEQGLRTGDRIVLSTLPFIAEGMLLDPVIDHQTIQRFNQRLAMPYNLQGGVSP